MLLVLVKLAGIDSAIARSQHTFSILHVMLPGALVPILLSSEYLALTMALISLPLADVEILIIVVTVALPFAQILPPPSMILIIGPLLLV